MGSSSSDLTVTGAVFWDLVVLCVSLLLSAFFSGSETALTALSEARAQKLIESGRPGTRFLRLWLDRPNRVLTTVLIGNNVVNTFTASLATLIAQQLFANAVLSLAVGITTIAILVVGEITPKTFAKHNAEKIAPISMAAITLLYYPFLPVIVAFTWLSKVLVKVMGGEVSRTGPFITEEDIAFMLRLGENAGVIEQEERQLLANVFEFNDTLVKEVMVPRTDISALPMAASLEDVLREIREHGHTRMPVYGENLDDIKGFFHAKDLLEVLPDKVESFSLADVVRPALFVPELEKISEVLKKFQRTKTHLAVVVDEYGGTAGILSLEDILEELVGNILDEHDDEKEELIQLDEGHYVAEGKASVYDIGEALGIQFPKDDRYETLGGFLIATSGKMPRRGERIVYGGWAFVVAEVDEKRVARVEIEREPEQAEGDDEDRPNGEARQSGEKRVKVEPEQKPAEPELVASSVRA